MTTLFSMKIRKNGFLELVRYSGSLPERVYWKETVGSEGIMFLIIRAIPV